MLEANRMALLARLDDQAQVLDVGGGGLPFERADYVIDVMPYSERGLYGKPIAPESEHFSELTWVERDMCDHEPWPFSDHQFDFVVCSHTLEDVRDPIWVCREMSRVAKAGYIEVPSRLEEQSYGFQGGWVGWGHHRWLIDIDGEEIEFVFKHHVVHASQEFHFNREFHRELPLERRVQWLWWEGSCVARERVMLHAEDLDGYLSRFVAANDDGRRPLSRRALSRIRRSCSQLLGR
jgi:hypothetical protein